MKVIIKNFSTSGRNFTICYDQEHYLAIEDKYLDDRGCLKQALCGAQMYAMRTLKDCLRHVEACVHQDQLIAQGYSLAKAFCLVNGVEYTQQIEDMFNGISAAVHA